MRIFIVLMLVVVVILPGIVSGQDGSSLSAEYDGSRPKVIGIEFQPPPPPMYYVPGALIVKVNSEEAVVNSLSGEDCLTTNSLCLNALNARFEVTEFIREFPGLAVGTSGATIFDNAQKLDLRKYFIVSYRGKFAVEEVVDAYANCADISLAQPIGIHPVYESFPNDPYFPSQWDWHDTDDNDIDATDAWDHETGDTAVILADLDTGLQYTSRDLGGLAPYVNGNVWINWPEYNGMAGIDDDGNGYVDDWIGWDFVSSAANPWPGEDASVPDNEPTDFNGHGTHVAGIMGAITNNSYAVAGLAGGWNENANDPASGVKIMPCRIGWSANYLGQEVGYVRMDFAAQAIYYAVNNGATAINCSWGSSNTGGLGAAVDYATANDVFIVAAAGNDNSQYADYLGTRADVIDVCATDSNDVKASFSNYGSWVDVAAPGVKIYSTYSYHYNPNYVAWMNGTSQAAPHVTGEAGLLKSHNSSLTRQEIFDLIVNYTDDIYDQNPGYEGLLGSGRINVFKALDAAYAPEVTVTYPNGGEVFYIGQVVTVTWDASDNIGIIRSVVDYSVDGGQSWMPIDTLVGNPGEYDWTVTGPPSSTCRMKITCFDAVDKFGDDMSDEDFCPPYKRSTNIDGFAIGDPGAVPSYFALQQNSPNPFNPTTEIKYTLPEAGRMTLTVYNINGQKVRVLLDEFREAGEHAVVWNGTDENGRPVASGVYLYRLTSGDIAGTRKMVLLK